MVTKAESIWLHFFKGSSSIKKLFFGYWFPIASSSMFCLLLFSCGNGIGVEEVVNISLPDANRLLTVEGAITNNLESQRVKLTRTTSFDSDDLVELVTDAQVWVEAGTGENHLYSYLSEGNYVSNTAFLGVNGVSYRVRIVLNDGREIASDWEKMPDLVALNRLTAGSFLENDPDNPGEQIEVYFPIIVAIDPEGISNFYRWRFFKNQVLFDETESITIQDDRFFNGNLIPNDFSSFGYTLGDEMRVEFQSINESFYDYLDLLKAQITLIGTSSGIPPAELNGNLFFISPEENERVLGYFSTIAMSTEAIIIDEQ